MKKTTIKIKRKIINKRCFDCLTLLRIFFHLLYCLMKKLTYISNLKIIAYSKNKNDNNIRFIQIRNVRKHIITQ